MSRRRHRPPPAALRGTLALKLFAVVSVLGVALVAGVVLAGWIWMGLVVTIPLRDQLAGITLPERFDAVVEVNNQLDVAMKGEISAMVPFQQTLTVPMRGRFDFDVEMNARVPVQFDVRFDGVIPVDTEAAVTIRTGINYKNLKSLRNLVIETTLPLRFPLPVSLNIPVDDVIDLTYAGPLSADIDQDLLAPVDTVLRTRLPIDQTIRTPVTAAIPLEVRLDPGQVRLIISELTVNLRPSRMLGFGVATTEAREAGPQRVENPYGPQDTGPWPPRREHTSRTSEAKPRANDGPVIESFGGRIPAEDELRNAEDARPIGEGRGLITRVERSGINGG